MMVAMRRCLSTAVQNVKLLGQRRQHPLSELIYERNAWVLDQVGPFDLQYELETPKDVVALWLSIDGDDSQSAFSLRINQLLLALRGSGQALYVGLCEDAYIVASEPYGVVEETIRQELPAGFQRAEFLLEHGMVDQVVDRRELRSTLSRVLRHMLGAPARRRAPRRLVQP